MSTPVRTRLAQRGETFAARLYQRQGATVLDRNVRYPVGELDIIVREPDGTVVFVEVKTRSGRGYGGAEAVTGRKLARMRRAAALWLDGRPYVSVRFDVVALTTAGTTFEVECYEGVEHGAR
ncbi:YraN family protein [Corynebacterium testudinoris]|uniref:UPF0102 protein CTEST_08360 n=1 Tax=Corynebacterium testudinoris TaxID=136857 RepID=A0A0G3HD46_9CORY|nr:YraN family protein [Corynebacterium testudinoris]AKK09102.1 putative endonuclease related to Holliday junction resolvase [Corynebacterium testudinoris]MBX8996539.1 YraN family protein [Corynebacterium testudinoris]